MVTEVSVPGEYVSVKIFLLLLLLVTEARGPEQYFSIWLQRHDCLVTKA